MNKQVKNTPKNIKQRLTAFIDPDLVTRAKVRGALEGLTLSEVVEKALDEYAPRIEKDNNHHIKVKFSNHSSNITSITDPDFNNTLKSSKHTKSLVVPK